MLKIDDKIAYGDFKYYLNKNSPKNVSIQDDIITTDDVQVKVNPDFIELVSYTESLYPYSNSIIFGKNPKENIISIEVKDDKIHMFMKDGEVEYMDAVYWILSAKPYDQHFIKLKGNNHFKYIRTFKKESEYKKFKIKYARLDTYIIWDNVESQMICHGLTQFKGLTIEDISVLGFDIESSGLEKNNSSTCFVITNTYKDKNKTFNKQFILDDFKDQWDMIETWCKWVKEINPDIITGHNIFGYDLDYLNYIMSRKNKNLILGRDNSPCIFNKKPSKYRVDGSQAWDYYNCSVFGRHIIDGMFLAVKYDIGRNYESWGLKSIIEYEKLVEDDRQFYDASQIYKNWNIPEEKEKIIKYCKDDGEDSIKIFNLMIPSFFYLTRSIPKPFQKVINSASGSWLNSIFVRGYLQFKDSIPKADKIDKFEGGISYGIPGIYSNCFKQDVASLYPSIMRQYSVCEEKKDYKKLFPKVVEYFTIERLKNKQIAKDTKDPYYSALEQSQKIVINSLYGFMGANGINFNSHKMAAFVTEKGREILNKAIFWSTGEKIDYWRDITEKKLNVKNLINDLSDLKTKKQTKIVLSKIENIDTQLNKLNNDIAILEDKLKTFNYKLVNCDTDSIMICKKDQSFWNKEERSKFILEMNKQFKDLIIWEDDGYYDRVIVVKAKNYVLKEEGSNKIKIKGSSFKSSSKEKALAAMLKEIMTNLINNEDWFKTYEKYLKEVSGITNIDRWATKLSITQTLLEANDTSKKRKLKALEGEDIRVGDKVYLYKIIDEKTPLRPKIVKDKPIYNKKSGEMQLEDNVIYRISKKFNGNYHLPHYLSRVYSTLKILKNVIDLSRSIRYDLKSNIDEFKKRY